MRHTITSFTPEELSRAVVLLAQNPIVPVIQELRALAQSTELGRRVAQDEEEPNQLYIRARACVVSEKLCRIFAHPKEELLQSRAALALLQSLLAVSANNDTPEASSLLWTLQDELARKPELWWNAMLGSRLLSEMYELKLREACTVAGLDITCTGKTLTVFQAWAVVNGKGPRIDWDVKRAECSAEWCDARAHWIPVSSSLAEAVTEALQDLQRRLLDQSERLKEKAALLQHIKSPPQTDRPKGLKVPKTTGPSDCLYSIPKEDR